MALAVERPEIQPGFEVDGDESLRHQYYKLVYQYLTRYRDDMPASCQSEGPNNGNLENLLSLLRGFHRVAFYVENLSLLSPNECLDDINTEDLLFLWIPFVLAELSSDAKIVENKLNLLKCSMVYWQHFLRTMETLTLCSKLDLKRCNEDWTSPLDPASKRLEKLEAYRAHKDLNGKISVFIERIYKSGGSLQRWGSGIVEEELERELIVVLLKRSIIEAIDHMSLVRQEIELLEMASKRAESSLESESISKRPEKKKMNKDPVIIQIDRTGLRKAYLERVFKPFHELPSISLDEVVRWEMDLETNQRVSVPENQNRPPDNSSEGSRVTESEDTDSDEGDSRTKKLQWDDWKDDHPRGSGNKNRNVA